MSRWISSRASEERYNHEHGDGGKFAPGGGGEGTVANLKAGDTMQKTNMRTGKVETVKVTKVEPGGRNMTSVTVQFKSGEQHTELMGNHEKTDTAMSTKDALAAGAKGDAWAYEWGPGHGETKK